jgi:predicted aspartyl protease
MGTPRKKLTICGTNACGSAEALLDTGADMTLLSREFAEKVGAAPLGETTSMKSATGQAFEVQQAIVSGHLDRKCGGLLKVGITNKENLGGEDAIIGNDMMGQKCMKIEFDPEECGVSQSVRVGCDCRHFFMRDGASD